jgi:hypothetical protein
MSSRPILAPQLVITNGNMASTITSLVTILQTNGKCSYDVSWVGTAPVGTVNVQVSNTYTQNADGTVRNPGDWTTLTLSTPSLVSGASGNNFIDITATGAYAIRLQYVPTSGTGTMNATIAGKV